MILPTPSAQAIVYPESDGQPMADNSIQFRWIVVLFNNLAALFHEAADVYVAGNLFWYPLQGESEIRQAPDVMVVFGRPKRDRSSYKQWEEDNVPVQVVFEILSPGNDGKEMVDKALFYEEFGVEEYYLYDPERNQLSVWRRQGQAWRRVWKPDGWVSQRLGIRLDLSGPELIVYRPDGQRFRTFEEIQAELTRQEQLARTAIQEAERQRQRAERLAERLRQLGVDPDA